MASHGGDDWEYFPHGDWYMFPTSFTRPNKSVTLDRAITIDDAKALLDAGAFFDEYMKAINKVGLMSWHRQSRLRRTTVLRSIELFRDAARSLGRKQTFDVLSRCYSALREIDEHVVDSGLTEEERQRLGPKIWFPGAEAPARRAARRDDRSTLRVCFSPRVTELHERDTTPRGGAPSRERRCTVSTLSDGGGEYRPQE
jgi:hypothetical protein